MDQESRVCLPCHAYLDQLRLPYKRCSFSPATEKGAASVARAIGLEERQAVKTLIFETGEGESLLIMLGGDQNAVSGLLKEAVGSRNIKLASPEKVKELTGYAIGSIPPFSWQPEGFRTIIEATLMDEPVLGVGTGSWGEEILIEPPVLVEASKARVENLTTKEER